MAEKQDFIITIAEDGEVMVTVEGISGPKCIKATDFLLDDLGEILSQEKTSDYYKKDSNEDHIHTAE